ncbi:MAG: hypothetical protein ACRD4M_11590 [Candidatus Acidiferrales bacterium]
MGMTGFLQILSLAVVQKVGPVNGKLTQATILAKYATTWDERNAV